MSMPPFISMNQPFAVRPSFSGFHKNGAFVQRRTNASSYA